MLYLYQAGDWGLWSRKPVPIVSVSECVSTPLSMLGSIIGVHQCYESKQSIPFLVIVGANPTYQQDAPHSIPFDPEPYTLKQRVLFGDYHRSSGLARAMAQQGRRLHAHGFHGSSDRSNSSYVKRCYSMDWGHNSMTRLEHPLTHQWMCSNSRSNWRACLQTGSETMVVAAQVPNRYRTRVSIVA